jgi:hypothetical protein
MSNKYFDSANNPNRAVPYEVARAEQINNTDDLIEQGLNLVEADIIRAIKLPEGTAADQVITATPSQRQNNLLGFDAAGNATVVGGDVAARQGKVMAWDADGNVLLRDYANDVTAPANQVAQDKIDVVQLKVDTQAIKDSAVSETTAIRDTALAHRNEALQFRNEAEVFKNQAGALAAGDIIDDSVAVSDMTWSSQKLSQFATDTQQEANDLSNNLTALVANSANSVFYTSLFL